MPERWTRDSWRQKPIAQVPNIRTNRRSLGGAAPCDVSAVVFAGRSPQPEESTRPRRGGEIPAAGWRLAEAFTEHSANNVSATIPRLPARLSADGGGAHLCRRSAGGESRRIAGQFASPHVADGEAGRQGMPSYRGDIINSVEFDEASRGRTGAPRSRLFRHSAATLNLLRAFVHGGYANLANVRQWTLGFVKDSPQSHHYEELADASARRSASCKPAASISKSHPESRARSSTPP